MADTQAEDTIAPTQPHPFIRDLRIFLRIVLVIVYYWTVGWFVRRRYAWLQSKGRAYYVDEEKKRGVWDWQHKDDLT